ncbi:MAG TPA: DUF2953 domain-containing protein [Candidatus Marinimicrobia bacterium]|jgi:hypothetical protein|nr:hypothetical protein [Candidatus Neomarinimicrobiota bacterium]MDP6276828.1 DUF2953 domain-containing protein [Candidatus Neomarinimicrobiota bacterium]MDP7217393.1 DUF2953 domain-containing protein [Candidatus Neomarinimicrobiota bacterium]MDP7437375.1 DUF2953 domain-containing protein [Candidatus Neomarinimicrobiota bacterium]HJL74564.1 DUF2953 domain-containing protein [Candidatus Neomarinimicrobiota bacterium]|tara:strand:+ start:4620 stop:5216 length:597 start_codon:yes stop_codon:yes gene_type:complete
MIGTLIYVFLTLLGIILLFVVIPIRVRIQGRIKMSAAALDGDAHLLIGYHKRGLSINILKQQNLAVGAYTKPLFFVPLKKKSKKLIEPNKEKKSFMQIVQKLHKIPKRKLLRAVVRSIHWEEFSIAGQLGLKNPMHTGMAFGWMNGLSGIIHTNKLNFAVTPAFKPVLNTYIKGNIHVRLSPLLTALHAGITYFKFRK